MVKTYLKYQLKDVLGQITGKTCKPKVSPDGKFLFAGCNEYVMVIDLKTGQVVNKILDNENEQASKSEVTCLNIDENNTYLAVGHNSGIVVLYDVKNEYSLSKKFSLHKSAVTTIQFNKSMNLLATGSKDTNVFIWDIVGESVLYKLAGHKDNITKVLFYKIKFENYDEIETIISCSKDSTIKIWNIKSQETLQTIADLVYKVTDFIIYENWLIVGSYDNKLRIYKFQQQYSNELNINTFVSLKGSLSRQSNSKIISLNITNEKLLSVLSNDNSLEFFKILSTTEVKNRIVYSEMNKLKKQAKREKLIIKDKYQEINEKVKKMMSNDEYNFKQKFFTLFKFMGETKITGQFFIGASNINNLTNLNNNIWKFGISLANNSIEIYDLFTTMINQNIFSKNKTTNLIEEKKLNEENLTVDRTYTLDTYGHRDTLRYIKFASDDNIFLTASNDCIRLWNYSTKNVIKGNKYENVISGLFIFNDKYLILGTRKGELLLLNTNSLDLVNSSQEKAHEGEIWSITAINPTYKNSKVRIVTCSSDKTIKYWTIDPFSETVEKYITLNKTIDANEQITFCMLSPDNRYLIYSLLDNSIKIFYEDSNKFFLNLYGHKLPVLSFDVSSDGTLLISGSADKNVKLWGMDFGDCHKSFFAHQDSVTSVKFVNKTHYFFSAGKDKVVRYWDADSYELIMEMNDFFSEVWCLDINSLGTGVVAVSADYSIRVYEICSEQILPDWEKENKLDKNIEDEMQKEMDITKSNVNQYNKDIEKIVPIKKSMDNIGLAEDLMDSLDNVEKFKNEVYQYEIALEEYQKSLHLINQKNTKSIKTYNLEKPEVPQPSLHLLGKSIFEYLLFKLKKIKFAELENTLNNLPYSYVQLLFFYLEYFIRNNIEIELCARCVLFLTTLFESQLSNDKTLVRLLDSIRLNLRKNLKLTKEVLNFNIQSIDFIIRNNQLKEKSIEEYKDSYKINNLI